MVSMKIHGSFAAAVAVLFLAAFVPCRGSTEESANYIAPAPAPAPPSPYSSPPTRRIQPVIVVQGVIYCKSCKLNGYNPYMDASPLPNATAQLVCYGDRLLNLTSTATDQNGYFLVMVYDLATFSRNRCRIYLGSSPTSLCSAPFIPSNRWLGITLERERVASLPKGVRGVYRPRSALMYGPGSGGKCPPY